MAAGGLALPQLFLAPKDTYYPNILQLLLRRQFGYMMVPVLSNFLFLQISLASFVLFKFFLVELQN